MLCLELEALARSGVLFIVVQTWRLSGRQWTGPHLNICAWEVCFLFRAIMIWQCL